MTLEPAFPEVCSVAAQNSSAAAADWEGPMLFFSLFPSSSTVTAQLFCYLSLCAQTFTLISTRQQGSQLFSNLWFILGRVRMMAHFLKWITKRKCAPLLNGFRGFGKSFLSPIWRFWCACESFFYPKKQNKKMGKTFVVGRGIIRSSRWSKKHPGQDSNVKLW